MNKVTSINIFDTEIGTTIAITYSVIDEQGNVIKRNIKTQKVLVDETAKSNADALKVFAQSIINN